MPRIAQRLIVVIVVVVGLLVVKNVMVKAAVTGGVKAVTGLGLEMDRLDVALLKGAVDVNGLRVRNPRGFPDPIMLQMPELYVDVNPAGFFKGETHVEALRVNIEEFLVVRNAEGALNVDALKAVQSSKAPAEDRPTPHTGTLRVDALELQVGRVVFKDYSRGGEPQVREFVINLHERHEDITNPQALAALIVTKALARTTIASLTDFDLRALESTMSGAVGRATELVGSAAASAQQLQEQAAAQLKASAEAGKEAVEGAGETLKKLLPFGN